MKRRRSWDLAGLLGDVAYFFGDYGVPLLLVGGGLAFSWWWSRRHPSLPTPTEAKPLMPPAGLP